MILLTSHWPERSQMVPADFEGGVLYISGGRVTDQLNIKGSITKEEVGSVLRGTVGMVEEVVWPGKSGLAKPEDFLCSQSLLSSVQWWTPAQSCVRVQASTAVREHGCWEADGHRLK